MHGAGDCTGVQIFLFVADSGLSTLPCKEAAFGSKAAILNDDQNRQLLTLTGYGYEAGWEVRQFKVAS